MRVSQDAGAVAAAAGAHHARLYICVHEHARIHVQTTMTGTTMFATCAFACVISAVGGVNPHSPADWAPGSAGPGGAVTGGGGHA